MLPTPFRTATVVALAAILAVSACSSSDEGGLPERGARTETRLLTIDTDAWSEGSFVASPDRRHAAYIGINEADQRFAVLDGAPGKVYKRMGDLQFSPDGQRLAHVGQRDDELVSWVAGGVEGPWYPTLDTSHPIFDPTGSRIGYGVRDGDDAFIVVDGVEGPRFKGVSLPYFSPDGWRVAYWAETDDTQLVVVDGVEGVHYTRIPTESIRWSLDGSRLAYAANKDNQWTMVVDGEPGPMHPSMGRGSPVFLAGGSLVY